MSTTVDSSLHTMPSATSQATSVVANSLKYPHTRAVLASIAAAFKQLDNLGDSVEPDQEGDEGQQVNGTMVSKVVALLQDEKEDELKEFLKDAFSIPESVDDSQLDESLLELMHKHRDDISGVPFLFLTPTKRPVSRPSSRASSHSYRLAPNRPDTPNSLPASPLSSTFRRPHTPAASPLVPSTTSSYMTAGQAQTHAQSQPPQVSSASSSPLSSPRLLNAKAVEFRPIPRPLSAGGSSTALAGVALRTDTPSPDLWAHNPSRATSNLAIAAPLVPDTAYAPAPRAITPSSLQRASNIDEEYEDEFDPFSTKPRSTPPSFHSTVHSDVEIPWSNSSNSTSSQSTSLETSSTRTGDEENANPYGYPYQFIGGEYEYDQGHDFTQPDEGQTADEHAEILTDGMTPFDVLSSVFGQSLAPAELHEALEVNGYDFESAMAWLVDKALPQTSQLFPTISAPRPQPEVQMGGRVIVVPRDAAFNLRGRGFPSLGGRNSPRYGSRPVQGANRVCRYFLAGECMRADCRFSHDIERAMCRFWLRGNCAKQDNCEFLHHLPKDVDVSSLTAAMARTDLQLTPGLDSREASPVSTPPPEDFPTLAQQESLAFGRGRRGTYQYKPFYDPGRMRFATAVKAQAKPMLQPPSRFGARRPGMQRSSSANNTYNNSGPAPRLSPRLKLRPPTLLPTLPTGESINNLYMSYRQRTLQLGAARNACLSRAADAWRRGDGAAAKRFSREGHDLNARMGTEAADAASRLLRERVRIAAEAARQRDVAWSDDPQDRAERGKIVGGGFGVTLGVASKDVGAEKGGVRATPEERTEVLVDLHGLHANEAVEVIEKFLITLESEGFFGLVYLVVGEEKHTGTQDPSRGTSRARLATGVRDWLHEWGYPWSERDGIVCVDPLTHS